jgi:3-dehydro-L-gulonate 2-dehydrogenase
MPGTRELVPYDRLHSTMRDVLLRHEMEEARAELCARLFADASRDGIESHGLNRFGRFVAMIRNGMVVPNAVAERTSGSGPMERWNGRHGPGNLNAHACMGRAIELAAATGVGIVALANTNHWMRGGNHGWQAAEAGMIGLCWSNTLPNLPPWGAAEPRVGNNPLIIAVPRAAGHVVLDMAMSQFSVGALATYRMRGEQLPVAGGFDAEGRLTTDPGAIEASRRLLPMGFWKGAGLAVVLDMIAALLSGGTSTHEIPPIPERETGQSQVFIAIDPSALGASDDRSDIIDRIVESLRGGDGADDVRYPGERTLETRRASLRDGVPVDAQVWNDVRAL